MPAGASNKNASDVHRSKEMHFNIQQRSAKVFNKGLNSKKFRL